MAHNGIQAVFVVGPLMEKMTQKLPQEVQKFCVETPEKMLDILKSFVQTGDVVLVKSSHGTGLYKLVEKMKGN